MPSKKILIGAAAALMLLAAAYLATGAETGLVSDPASAAAPDTTGCIYPKEYMHSHHMQVLADWKEHAAHEGPDAVMTAPDGRRFQKDLATCLGCHSDNRQFCFSCHTYANVKPNCWNCHISPQDLP
ncbi:hypothetical protein [Chlorobium sp. N1]|uniref:hypothetical protein n=1 Tax=Chlorobium sp. N1 TaxID=2491138 RepID=UPI0010403708|nr:hypothetical protein [Chlorobium sp. N1]TCD48239.1 hypothetical protein E0L29_04995 [Chlorobium sp. N1]